MLDIEERSRLLKIASTASVVTATTLIIVKLAAWYYTNSVGIMASLIDSLMDVGASAINFFAIRYALMPPDEEHKFGHGKAEPLAGLSQAAFICGSVVFLIIHAMERFLYPTPIENPAIGQLVMCFSIVATLGLLGIQRYVISKTQSTAIEADSLHYLSDLLTNFAILISLVLVNYGMQELDPIIAILVGLLILHSAVEIAKKAINMLMDHELEESDREAIFEVVRKNKNILGMHDLRTRQSGQTVFAQFHIEMDDEITLRQAHDIADEIELDVKKAFPNMDVIIHTDPIGVVDDSVLDDRRSFNQSTTS